jgi:hypothetical protein
MYITQRHEIWVVSVVIFDQDALVLKPYDGDAIAMVFGEGGDPQSKG